MKEQLQKQLQHLNTEYPAGQVVLAELGEKRKNTQETLIRIHGAIDVLKEMLNEDTEHV